MPRQLIDLTGKIFGYLRVSGRALIEGDEARWRCECVCGNVKIARSQHLRAGSIKSCGCSKRGRKPSKEGVDEKPIQV